MIYLSDNQAGTDEAGRGCLAGPVTAAAVILPSEIRIAGLNDSKKLSASQRDEIKVQIKEHALAWSVVHVDIEEIDRINILNASILAMQRAIDGLKQKPTKIFVDGNRFKPFKDIPYECVIKGDSKIAGIAAASILAKTARDELMQQLHEQHPYYNWAKNKGYPTKEHREAILKNGITEHHRKSFRQLPKQLNFQFQ